MKFNQMTDVEKSKLLIAMYFLNKGSHQLRRLHDEFSPRETDKNSTEAGEVRRNLFSSIARIEDLHLYSEQMTENEEIQKLEVEFEWIEDKGFTEEIKKYFSQNSIMFS